MFIVLTRCHSDYHLGLLTVQGGGVEALGDLYHSGSVGQPGLDHVPKLPPPGIMIMIMIDNDPGQEMTRYIISVEFLSLNIESSDFT